MWTSTVVSASSFHVSGCAYRITTRVIAILITKMIVIITAIIKKVTTATIIPFLNILLPVLL